MKLGKFYVLDRLMNTELTVIKMIMADLVVVRCEHLWGRGLFEYVAISDVFEDIKEGDVIPLYDVIIQSETKEKSIPSVRFILNKGHAHD